MKRYAQGEFGNAAPTWDGWLDWNLDNLGRSKLTKFHIRNRVAGAQTWYNVCKFEMPEKWLEATRLFKPEQLYISEMAPTELTLIQGEVMRTHQGLHLFYSLIKRPMRDALNEKSDTVWGVKAVYLLRHFLCANSYSWLETLLDRYPDHVVELSTFDVEWGTVPGFNTAFWEVRRY